MQLLRKYRLFAVFALLIIVCAVTAGGIYVIQPPPRPDPKLATRDQMLRYLVVGNLTTDPVNYQVAVVDRLMADLADSSDLPTNAAAELPASYKEQLRANLNTLEHAWFVSRVDRYHELAAQEQGEFLDDQINAVLAWSRLDVGLQDQAAGISVEQQRAAYAGEFFGQIDNWIAEANAEQTPLMRSAVQQAIIRWLSTRSLEEEPRGTRQELAEAIVRALDRGMKLERVLASLDSEHQTQLSANSLLLIEAWLHELAIEYEQLPVDQQAAYIDRRLDQITQWNLASLMVPSAEGQSGGGSAMSSMQASLKILSVINRWIARADEESRPRFEAFMMDLQKQWLARQMKR
jgi:hypothetical protein